MVHGPFEPCERRAKRDSSNAETSETTSYKKVSLYVPMLKLCTGRLPRVAKKESLFKDKQQMLCLTQSTSTTSSQRLYQYKWVVDCVLCCCRGYSHLSATAQ